MMRWTRWLLAGLISLVVLAFAVDWLVYNLRGAPSASITVSHFLSAPLKNNKQELDYLGSDQQICAESLFPQQGRTPCWYLRRHTNQITTI